MLRVIGGALRGRNLRTPEGRLTRPTSARVRQAIFDVITHHPSLGVDLNGARVADLYAGSGALGIEALSRGAALAVFVERDPGAVKLLRRNLRELGLEDRAEVWARDVRRSREALGKSAPFRLMLMDPPYAETDSVEADLAALGPAQLLAEDGLLMLERASGSSPLALGGLPPPLSRRWGDTEAFFYSPGFTPDPPSGRLLPSRGKRPHE